MKKIFIFMMCIFMLGGCSGNTDSNSQKDVTSDNKEVSSELKNPEIKWCQLYNPNGYDTVTCVISNPNDVDIDISYDLVFYKDGKEVSRSSEQWSNFEVSPKHDDVIWSNDNIPSKDEADDVKMENITVTKAQYESIDADINYTETIEDKAYFSVSHESTPSLSTIWVFEYNDDNGNKKCDKGELVVVSIESVFEQKTDISIDTDVYEHNAYEVYYNAY